MDNNVVVNFTVGGLKEASKDISNTAKSMTEFNKITSEATDEMTAFTQSIDLANKKLSTLEPNSKEWKELNNEIKASKVAFESLATDTATLKREFTNTKNEIVATEKALNKLRTEGLANTQQANNLKQKLQELKQKGGELKDQIGDLSSELSTLGSDTRGVDTVIQGIQGIVAGFEIGAGAVALFGEKNKDLEEALIKLNGVMAIANGLQQIQQLTQKETAISTGVMTAANAAYTFVMEGATLATQAFRAALVSIGIGAVIAGVYALYEAFKSLSDAQNESAEAALRNKEAQELAAKELDNELATLKLRNDFEVKNGKDKLTAQKELTGQLQTIWQVRYSAQAELNQRISQLEQENEGANAAEILKLKKEAADNQVAVANAYYEYQNSRLEEQNIKEQKATKDNAKKKKEIVLSEIDDLLNQVQQREKAQAGEEKRLLEEEMQLFDDLWNQAQQLRNATIAEEQRVTDEMVSDVDEIIAAQEKELKETERIEAKKLKIKTEAINALKSAQSVFVDLAQFGIQSARDNAQAQLQEDLDRISKLREEEIKNKDLTEAQKAAIDKKYRLQESAVKLRAWRAEQDAKKSQAIINGALALTDILAKNAGNPFVVAILSAAAIAKTALEVATISSQKPPKFAEGGSVAKRLGYIDGKPHSAGGEVIEVEGNEFVMRKEAVNKYGIPFMEKINNMEMPKPSQPKQVKLDYTKIGQAFAQELRNNPTLQVKIDKRGVSVHKGGYELKNNYIDF